MSPKLRRLSGREVVSILNGFGFDVHSQRGSHIKLRRVTTEGEKQILTIPFHGEFDAGTLRAIIRQAAKYIPLEELKEYFYSS